MSKVFDYFIPFELSANYHDLLHYWNDETYHLNGIDKNLNYSEPITRDQAVDENGKAFYDEYVFYTDDEEYADPQKRFTSDDIERFFKTF